MYCVLKDYVDIPLGVCGGCGGAVAEERQGPSTQDLQGQGPRQGGGQPGSRGIILQVTRQWRDHS